MRTRRLFLRDSAVVMAGVGTAPLWLARAASAAPSKRKILVAIFQRGAADALNMVVPFADKPYYALRPSLAIPAPGAPNAAIDLDGHFGLHPQLQPLKSLWDKQQLAIVQATGSPDPSRSHFDAQDFMESGTAGQTRSDGWMNRALAPATPETSPVRAVAVNGQMPRTLRGDRSAVSVSNLMSFRMGGQVDVLERMYGSAPDGRVSGAGRDAFAALKLLRSISQQPPAPGSVGSQQPYFQAGDFGRGLQQLAQLIKADVGVEAAFAEVGGWDHHSNENGQLAMLLRQFSGAIEAFYKDLGDRMEDVVLVTMSEFGRTAQENGTNGTDHGHGSLMMVMGGPVRGGKMYGTWPGLEHEQLYEGRDLAVTTDYRDVLGELVAGHLGQTDLTRVFPGHQPGKPLGLLAR